jgi:uncharacterized membrane protein
VAESPEIRQERELRFGPERLVFLIDGVFAIAMTLLALEVKIPAGESFAAGWDELRFRLGIFVVAFFITSRFWLVNHRQLRRLHHVNHGVLECALLFLLGICALPVATNVLFDDGGEPQAVTFAAAVLAFTTLASGRLWWYVSAPTRDLADVDPLERVAGLCRTGVSTVVYLLAIPVAFVLPDSSYAPMVWFLLLVGDPAADRLARIGRSGS